MRIPWELLLVVVLLTVVTVATQQVTPERTEAPNLASDSAAPGGAQALFLWLQSLGYRVERLEYRTFQPDEGTRVLLMLAPTMWPGKDDSTALRRWVERGGTLIVAGTAPVSLPGLPVNGLISGDNVAPAILREFGLALRPLDDPQAEARPGQPLLSRPPVSSVRVETSSYISGSASLVPYLGQLDHPVAAGLAVGDGKVYVLASDYALSNRGLGEADNAALLLNWLPAPREAGTVAFDEIHHGRYEARSLSYVMLHEPWGWAVLYALGIIFLYLLLGGRRLGRPVPSIVDTRRAAAEYVISMANLLRRGHKNDWAARHFERMLRRHLAAACGLDSTLDTSEVAARLGEMDRIAVTVAGKDASRALLELHDGARNGIPEGHLVRLAAEADRIIKACGRTRR